MVTPIALDNELASNECQTLAKALGFSQYPTSMTAQPYLQHIISKCNNSDRVKDFLWLFSEIVAPTNLALPAQTLPRRSIATIINTFEADAGNRYFLGRVAPTRLTYVTNTVFLILGLWSMMEMNFDSQTHLLRPIIWAFNARVNNQLPAVDPLTRSFPELVEASGLIPDSSNTQNMPQSITSTADPNSYFPIYPLSIPARNLNLSKLATLAGINVHWTDNIARHLLLSPHAGTFYVELYAFPCTLDNACRTTDFLERTGISVDYMNEISTSYAILFNPVSVGSIHKIFNCFGARRFFCWCLSCTSYRLKHRQYRILRSEESVLRSIFFDPALDNVTTTSSSLRNWNKTSYPNLWSRIVTLESALQNAKPWSFWVLFRDRREKLPFWTFL
jgi:hypothetical protein